MTQLLHIKIQFPARSISFPDSISKTETWACRLYFILEAKRIENSCLLTLVYLLRFIYCVDDLTRLRVYFRAKHRRSSCKISNTFLARSTKVTTVSAKRNGAWKHDRREKRRGREIERDLYRCIARTQRPGEYISAPGGTISSIKYTPPSLDKLKRRMTVLRRRFCRRCEAEARKGVSRAYDSLAYQIARTRSIL